jgi:hypothetical protein
MSTITKTRTARTSRKGVKIGPRQSTIAARTAAMVRLTSGAATRSQLGLSVAQLQGMLDDGIIKPAQKRAGKTTTLDVQRTGTVGRPAHKYVLTDRSRAKARRLAQRGK